MSRFWIRFSFLLVATLTAAAPVHAQRELPLNAQPKIADFNLQPLYYGSVDVGDYDADGDPDLILSGRSGSHMMTRVYCLADVAFQYFLPGSDLPRVDTMKTFLSTTTDLPSLWQGDVKWGDIDGDSDLDVIVSGLNGIGDAPPIGAVTRLYEHRGEMFIESQPGLFPGTFAGENAFGDYDNDGDPDLIITGATQLSHPYSALTALFTNQGGTFTRIPTNLPAVAFGAVAWADIDDDGDLDLALQGELGSGRLLTDVFRNVGGGMFEPVGLDTEPVAFGSFDWADVDEDGDPDLLVSGGRYDPNLLRGVTEIFINEGGRFTSLDAQINGAVFGSAVWSDFDLDGRLDVVLNGARSIGGQPVFEIFLNSGTSFDRAFSTSGMIFSDLATLDYNRDGDPDVLTVGRTFDQVTLTSFFINEIIHDPVKEDYLNFSVIETFGCRSP